MTDSTPATAASDSVLADLPRTWEPRYRLAAVLCNTTTGAREHPRRRRLLHGLPLASRRDLGGRGVHGHREATVTEPGSAAKCERCGHGWDRHSDNGGPKGTRNWCRGIPYAGGCDCTEPTPEARAEGRAAAAAWNAHLGRDE